MDSASKNKIYALIITAIVFLGLYLVSTTYLQEFYLFEWTADNHYLYVWVIAIVLILVNKIRTSFALTLGNFVGILIGQFLGEWMLNQNIRKIVPGMDAQTVAELKYTHRGFEIWLLTMVIFLILNKVLTLLLRKRP